MAVYTGAFLKKWTRAQTGAETRAQNFVNWIATLVLGFLSAAMAGNLKFKFPPVSGLYIWQSDYAVNQLGNSYVEKTSILKKKFLEK